MMRAVLLVACAIAAVSVAEEPVADHPETMLGAYGPWFAAEVLGDGPAGMSLRSGTWASVDAWRKAGRERVRELMAPVDLGGPPEVEQQPAQHRVGMGRLATLLPS